MAQRKKPSYEGKQYTGGRKAKTPNLKRVEGGVINQHGVRFTDAEKRALENAVNTANRKRTRMLKAEAPLVRMFGGEPTGNTVGDLQNMGRESDFILARKSKSMQQFKTKAAYDVYMRNLKRVNDRGYIPRRVEQYRTNYLTALDNELGAEAADIKKAIAKMSRKEYMEMEAKNEDVLEIWFIYSKEQKEEKLHQIRLALGLED